MTDYRVISVQALGKKKYKVLLEGVETVILSLYPSEIRRYSISEGGVLSASLYQEIHEILCKRGKERALYYLKNSDKTVSQMRSKLKEGYYPEDIIDEVLSFLEKYGYIDDYRFAQNFVSYNKHNKSVKQLKNKLLLKGVRREIIDEVICEGIQDNEDVEERQIEAYCRKKLKAGGDDRQSNKIVMALIRRGFKYEQVQSVFRKVLEESTT